MFPKAYWLDGEHNSADQVAQELMILLQKEQV